MEYYISLTYNCNLSCSYCAARNVVFNSTINKKTIQKEVLDKILDYILKDYLSKREQSYIVFYGGEPTLEIDIVKYILYKTNSSKLKYILYTNGLLLDKFPIDVLNNIDIIFVSIDGDKETHDHYKYIGSYDKIIENARLIKNSNNKIIARITLQEESNLFNSVINVYKDFDYVFWQIVNKPIFINPQSMISNYRTNLKLLYNFWIEELDRNNFIKIIPFIVLMDNIYIDNRDTFKCGMGARQLDFDIQGNAYMCDEYINEKNHVCGNIDNPSGIKIYTKNNFDIFENCAVCSISEICRGRCRHALETFKKETLTTYCKLTKILIKEVNKININKFINKDDIELIKMTEQIP